MDLMNSAEFAYDLSRVNDADEINEGNYSKTKANNHNKSNNNYRLPNRNEERYGGQKRSPNDSRQSRNSRHSQNNQREYRGKSANGRTNDHLYENVRPENSDLERTETNLDDEDEDYNQDDDTEENKFKQEILKENRLALEYLKQENFDDSLKTLKKCERVLVKKLSEEGNDKVTLKLLSITLNNLSWYCKNKKRYQVALKYLARVLQIEKHSLNQTTTLASTYLNISAILSHMARHKEAFNFAKKANNMFLEYKEDLLEAELKNIGERNEDSTSKTTQDQQNLEKNVGQQPAIPFKINLAISFFNMGLSLANIGNKKEAYDIINQGLHFALIDLGESHPLTQNFKMYLEKLKQHRGISSYMKKKDDSNSDYHGLGQILSEKRDSQNRHRNKNHDKPSHRTLDPRNAYTRSHTIDNEGKHRLKFDRVKDEISIVNDYFGKKKSNTYSGGNNQSHSNNRSFNYHNKPPQSKKKRVDPLPIVIDILKKKVIEEKKKKNSIINILTELSNIQDRKKQSLQIKFIRNGYKPKKSSRGNSKNPGDGKSSSRNNTKIKIRATSKYENPDSQEGSIYKLPVLESSKSRSRKESESKQSKPRHDNNTLKIRSPKGRDRKKKSKSPKMARSKSPKDSNEDIIDKLLDNYRKHDENNSDVDIDPEDVDSYSVTTKHNKLKGKNNLHGHSQRVSSRAKKNEENHKAKSEKLDDGKADRDENQNNRSRSKKNKNKKLSSDGQKIKLSPLNLPAPSSKVTKDSEKSPKVKSSNQSEKKKVAKTNSPIQVNTGEFAAENTLSIKNIEKSAAESRESSKISAVNSDRKKISSANLKSNKDQKIEKPKYVWEGIQVEMDDIKISKKDISSIDAESRQTNNETGPDYVKNYSKLKDAKEKESIGNKKDENSSIIKEKDEITESIPSFRMEQKYSLTDDQKQQKNSMKSSKRVSLNSNKPNKNSKKLNIPASEGILPNPVTKPSKMQDFWVQTEEASEDDDQNLEKDNNGYSEKISSNSAYNQNPNLKAGMSNARINDSSVIENEINNNNSLNSKEITSIPNNSDFNEGGFEIIDSRNLDGSNDIRKHEKSLPTYQNPNSQDNIIAKPKGTESIGYVYHPDDLNYNESSNKTPTINQNVKKDPSNKNSGPQLSQPGKEPSQNQVNNNSQERLSQNPNGQNQGKPALIDNQDSFRANPAPNPFINSKSNVNANYNPNGTSNSNVHPHQAPASQNTKSIAVSNAPSNRTNVSLPLGSKRAMEDSDWEIEIDENDDQMKNNRYQPLGNTASHYGRGTHATNPPTEFNTTGGSKDYGKKPTDIKVVVETFNKKKSKESLGKYYHSEEQIAPKETDFDKNIELLAQKKKTFDQPNIINKTQNKPYQKDSETSNNKPNPSNKNNRLENVPPVKWQKVDNPNIPVQKTMKNKFNNNMIDSNDNISMSNSGNYNNNKFPSQSLSHTGDIGNTEPNKSLYQPKEQVYNKNRENIQIASPTPILSHARNNNIPSVTRTPTGVKDQKGRILVRNNEYQNNFQQSRPEGHVTYDSQDSQEDIFQDTDEDYDVEAFNNGNGNYPNNNYSNNNPYSLHKPIIEYNQSSDRQEIQNSGYRNQNNANNHQNHWPHKENLDVSLSIDSEANNNSFGNFGNQGYVDSGERYPNQQSMSFPYNSINDAQPKNMSNNNNTLNSKYNKYKPQMEDIMEEEDASITGSRVMANPNTNTNRSRVIGQFNQPSGNKSIKSNNVIDNNEKYNSMNMSGYGQNAPPHGNFQNFDGDEHNYRDNRDGGSRYSERDSQNHDHFQDDKHKVSSNIFSFRPESNVGKNNDHINIENLNNYKDSVHENSQNRSYKSDQRNVTIPSQHQGKIASQNNQEGPQNSNEIQSNFNMKKVVFYKPIKQIQSNE